MIVSAPPRRTALGGLISLALLFVPLVAVAASGTASLPSLTLTPAEGPPAISVQAKGTGSVPCVPDSYGTTSVALLWDGRGEPLVIAEATVDGFSASFSVPADAVAGTHIVSSTCWSHGDPGALITSATFLVQTPIALLPSEGKPGTTIAIQGNGFPSICLETIELRFDGRQRRAALELKVSGSAVGISGTFDVPDSDGDRLHEVSIHCPAGEGDPALAVANFKVLRVPPTTTSTTTSTSTTTTSSTTTTTSTVTTTPTTGATGTTGTTGTTGMTGTTTPGTGTTGTTGTTTPGTGTTGGITGTTGGIAGTTGPSATTAPTTTVPGTTSSRPGTSTTTTTVSTPTTTSVIPTTVTTRGPPRGPELTRSMFPASLRTPREVPTSVARVLRSAALAMALVLLVGFPAEIFNKTLEENHDEIRGWFRRRNRRRRLWRIPQSAQVVVFAVLGALLLCLVDPSAGPDRKTAALALGFLAAVPVMMLFFEQPMEAYYTRVSSLLSTLRVLPFALAVAAACALLSRVAHFQPGYVYGLFAGYAALRHRRLARAQEGKGILIGAVWVLVVSLLAWLVWGESVSRAAAGPRPSFGLLVLDATLSSMFVLGVEGVVFALIPLHFLYGRKLAKWSRTTWAIMFGLGIFGWVHVLFDTKAKDAGVVPLASMVALFVAFGTFSLAFWAYFRYRPRPVTKPSSDIDV